MQKAVIVSVAGLNARLASVVVQKAHQIQNQYQTKIALHGRQYKNIAATDFTALLHLRLCKGDVVWVSGQGAYSSDCVQSIVDILENEYPAHLDCNTNTCPDPAGQVLTPVETQALKEKFRLLLTTVKDGVCLLDQAGYIVYVNPAYLEIANQSAAQLIGKNVRDIEPNGAACRALDSGSKVTGHLSNQNSDTSLLTDVLPVMVNGEIAGFISIVKQNAKEVHSLNEKLRIVSTKAEYLEQKLRQEKEAGWYPERMKMEFSEQKFIRTIKSGQAFEKFIGMNEKVIEALNLAAKAAKSQSTVLISGASGTGKELVAEGIHLASPRSQGPLIKVNCAAIPANLLESELFGHEKGAFTGAIRKRLGKFELAHSGTIFLDEISEMELSMQVKLLRVLQSMEFERVGGEETVKVDVRVVAATNRDLEQMVKEGHFRADLYYRLNVIPVLLPALQEKRDDIPLLVDYFIRKFSQEFGKQVKGIKQTAMDALVHYNWPGNVRELGNIVERAIALSDSPYVELSDLPLHIRQGSAAASSEAENILRSIIKGEIFPLADYEKEIIKAALTKHGSYTAAGKVLGITHKTVAAKAQKYGLGKTSE